MTAEPATAEPPKHPLDQLTTFELRDYRRQLENAIAFFDTKDPVRQPATGCKPSWKKSWPNSLTAPGWPVPDPGRPHDVTGMTDGELERARRELRASLALARPDSPASRPILARLDAIQAEGTGQCRTT